MKDGLDIRGGVKYWYVDGKLHRTDGPAIKYLDGSESWYANGVCHRVDGPALTWANGRKQWYVNGKYIDCSTQKEFEQLMRLKAFW